MPGLCYGPDPGYQPLREGIERWNERFFGGEKGEGEEGKIGDRICITGGASQNLACVLQVYSDPVYTSVWMVAPCYFLACRIFEDSGGEFELFISILIPFLKLGFDYGEYFLGLSS